MIKLAPTSDDPIYLRTNPKYLIWSRSVYFLEIVYMKREGMDINKRSNDLFLAMTDLKH